ncbi:uncharacterized protein LOC117591385 [Drosophila guanche]|uniref:LysM domain-containing protein n=1 Tax=Drosophila guanche TaxID=7266 RepID=A0A3B0K6K7_DROGU|nr:uncharacterized protein LOC117591385 [Drosophila guanche]SPP89857.1 Hypothetical predicted protein [Drosophila guanche]
MSGRANSRITCELHATRQQLWGGPNMCGHQLTGTECWLLHPVAREDTMTSLALKYDTSIGWLCRANRMQWRDVLLTRRHVWVPRRMQLDPGMAPTEPAQPRVTRILNAAVSYASQRQNYANTDEFARDRDPLLITSEHHMSIEE